MPGDLRVLIVDDEAPARAELRYLLERVGGVKHTEEAETAADALAILSRERLDVLFLDIRMPGLSGLEAVPLVDRIAHRPEIVFVSAYDEHALEAFEHAAADYLLKPVSEARLRRTLERLAQRRPAGTANAPLAPSRVAGEKLPVEGATGTLLLRPADVRYIHVRGHESFAKTFDREHRTRSPLSELARRLAAHGFLRTHRSYLVNLEHVLELEPFFGSTYVLRVDDRERSEVPVSRAAAPAVRAALGL